MTKQCSICQRDFEEYGNNAWPVNEGTCCNECDWVVVLPARLSMAPGSLGSFSIHQEMMQYLKEKSGE